MQGYVKPSTYVLDRTKVGGDTKVSTSGTPLYLLRSQSIDYWLKDLAEQYNSTYEVYEDPIVGGLPVIKFTAKALRFKKVVRTIRYRDPKGTMLDFQFNSIAGEIGKETSTSAISEDGKAESEYKTVALTDGRDSTKPAQTFDGIPLVYNTRSREILNRDLVGSSVTVPSTSESSVKGTADRLADTSSFLGFITVKVVGHPDFQPDVMKIEGVGVRASTTYRFFQVQHSLSSAGYVCTMQGKTQESVEQGVDNKTLEDKNEEYLIAPLATPKGT
jgi:hypothetical protein